MSSTPTEVLDLAEKLLTLPASGTIDEATLRCSASRAYYAALHAADEALPLDLAPSNSERKGKSSHQAVIDAMILWARTHRPGRMDAIEVARGLPRLRSLRKHADYKLDEDFIHNHAADTLRIAKSCVFSSLRAAQKAAEQQA